MNFYHELALQQLDGLRNQEWPEPPDDAEALKEHEQRKDRIIADAAGVGSFIALVSISESMVGVLHALRDIERSLTSRHPGGSLGLHVVNTPGKENHMPPISPLTVDTKHNVQYSTSPKDASGADTPDTLSWHSSDLGVLNLSPSADTLSCLAITQGLGNATVTVTDGVNSDSQDVTVTDAALPSAVSINLSGTIVAK